MFMPNVLADVTGYYDEDGNWHDAVLVLTQDRSVYWRPVRFNKELQAWEFAD